MAGKRMTLPRRSKIPEKPLVPQSSSSHAKGTKKSTRKQIVESRKLMFKKSEMYHRMKREILAPFITKLLLKKRWGDLIESLDDECSVFDPHVLSNTTNGNSSKRREITLGMITEEDNQSEASFQEDSDWRNDENESD